MLQSVANEAVGVRKAASPNDETAGILKGLKLDKKFFTDRLNASVLQSLAPESFVDSGGDGGPHGGGTVGTMGRKESKELRKKGGPDFDIYLNESVMPVLAQALDALCRQITKMKALGDKIDSRVRDRFNPITWLAQQLLRRHPRAATTPRRMHIYRNFRDWADYERGRRELLRCKPKIEEVFNGFKLKDGVGKNTVPVVIASIDDCFRLRGALKGDPHMREAVKPESRGEETDAGARRRRNSVLGGGFIKFDEFWSSFSHAVVKHDVVCFSALEEGKRLIKLEEEENARREEAARLEEERRKKVEAEHQRLLGLYQDLYPKLQQNEILNSIIDDGKILTGDFLKPADPGFEIEVAPHGAHVLLLEELMGLLGYEALTPNNMEYKRSGSKQTKGKMFRTKVKREAGTQEEQAPPKTEDKRTERRKSTLNAAKKTETDAEPPPPEETKKPSPEPIAVSQDHWWTPALKSFWKVLQVLQDVPDPSGTVEREVLQVMTPPPDGFINLRKRVDMQFEVKAETGQEEDPIDIVAKISKKPSFEELAKQLNMPRGRLVFFHELFEGFLKQSDPSKQCAYPECPASLDKKTMFNLIAELQPHITEAELEARFRRIDRDGTGTVEFDEFVRWVYDDEVAVIGAGAKKMPLEDLAEELNIPLELVKYIYDCFVNELEEGVEDHYPDKPAQMPYEIIWRLVSVITPSIEKKSFDRDFKQLDVENKRKCTFDEVLELLDFQALPTELRTKYGATAA